MSSNHSSLRQLRLCRGRAGIQGIPLKHHSTRIHRPLLLETLNVQFDYLIRENSLRKTGAYGRGRQKRAENSGDRQRFPFWITTMFGSRGIQFSSHVDFNTLPVDCQNFLALTAAMLCFVCCGTKTMRANFSDH